MSSRDLVIRIKADASGFTAEVEKARLSTQRFGQEVEKAAQRRQALDTLAGGFMRVGLVAVAGSALAIKAAMDWEQAWTGVLKTVDGTDAQLAALEVSLRNLATATGFAHEEVAAVAEAAGQLGISTGGVAKFTETMLAMGVSTSLSAAEAATGIARFRNIMGSTEGEISNIGSAMVGLGNNFATTEGEILEMALRLAGAGRQAGLTEADVLGLAAAMSSVGIEAEAGGTAMSLTMKRIGAEVDTQGAKLGTFAQIAGMSAKDFSTSWKDDAAGALTEFIAGLDEAGAAGQSVNGILADLGITGIREADALLRLSANAEGVADALEMSSEAFRQNTALMEEAEKFYGTTQNTVKQAWAEIKDAAISAGQGLLPVVRTMADAIGGLASVLGMIPAPALTAFTSIAALGGTGLLAMAGLIKLHDSVTGMSDALRTMSTEGGRAGTILGTVGRAAGLAAIAVSALTAVNELGESTYKRSASEMSALAKELKNLGESGKAGKQLEDLFGADLGGKTQKIARDIRDLGGAVKDFQKYGDDNAFERTARNIFGYFPVAGTASAGIYQTASGIRDLDKALVELSRTDPEAAMSAFGRLRDTALDQKASVDDLANAFPQMTEVLRSSSEAMGGSADAAEVLGGEMEELAPQAQMAAEALQAANEATVGAAMSFFDMSAGLDDASLSLTEWINKLAEMAEAQADWSSNVVTAMQRGVSEGVIAEFEKLGPAGAKMLDELVNGSQENIDRLNGIFGEVQTTAADLAYLKNEIGQPVIAEFKVAGAEGAIETAIAVAEKYDLAGGTVQAILEALDYTPEVIAQVLAGLQTVEDTNPRPSVVLDDFTGPQFTSLFFNLDTVAGRKPRPQVILDDQASPALGGIFGQLNALAARPPTRHKVFIDYLRTGSSATGPQPGGGVLLPQANGGVVSYYANGGVENHVAQHAPAGAWRVWGEPETGGETYIPHHPSKRQRSLQIWAETGRILGAQGYANGAVLSASVGDVTAQLPPAAAAQISRAVSAGIASGLQQLVRANPSMRLAVEGF